MSEELKPCPFCGDMPASMKAELDGKKRYGCKNCTPNLWYTPERWNTRPIEDALNARIAELEAENERLSQLLHDEMSQLEIATDLGNKRCAALNKIYKDGEKHNTNWCKRIAQEGLGLK